ncbi:hypothetical protein Mefer_1127 [Methanocaldococcus fervens AG86]|uniref:DUF2178 domain-containing protein n=1 Tax=Methanocaldococcus fervens (strain DSM 4213 / JCM 15782 / AG86) TaxID=573064 RepID=C7P8Q5_METFA|nr:hypothetical protein Mefer_1127 [Methanocaldococcus fervens AG86]
MVVVVSRDMLRGISIIATLIVAGYVMGVASKLGDVLLFTATFLIATAVVSIIILTLGPMKKGDERMIKRSEEAALLSVRVCMFIGLFALAYSTMLGFEEMKMFFLGMSVPGMLWVLAYLVLVWRDVH